MMGRTIRKPLPAPLPTVPMTLPLSYAMKRAVVLNKGGLAYAALKNARVLS